MENILKQLKQLREEKNWSLADVAEKLDIPENFLNMIELGEMTPTEKQIEQISNFVLDNLGE